jgi:hypothetical protein
VWDLENRDQYLELRGVKKALDAIIGFKEDLIIKTRELEEERDAATGS